MGAERESPESAVARALSLLTAFTFVDPVLGVSELGRRVQVAEEHRASVAEHPGQGGLRRTHARRAVSTEPQAVRDRPGGRQQPGPSPGRSRAVGEAAQRQQRGDPSGGAVGPRRRLPRPARKPADDGTVHQGRAGAAPPTRRRRARSCWPSARRPMSTTPSPVAFPVSARARSPPALGLNQALAEVRKAGYAVSTDEAAPGVVSIAAPIFDRARGMRGVGIGRRPAHPHAGRASRPARTHGGEDRRGDLQGARQRPGIDPLTIDTPSSDVDGSRHNLVGSPSTNDSHVPQSPLSQPRRGRSYLARNRMANSADMSDHVANEKCRPSISKVTSRSKGFSPGSQSPIHSTTLFAIQVRPVSRSPERQLGGR